MDLTRGFTFLFEKVEKIFLSPGSAFSVTSLACALIVAIAFVVVRRRRRNRTVRLRTILHALFPSRITASASHSLDVGYFFFNTFVFSLIFGGAILSYQAVSNATIAGLVNVAGQTQPAALHDIVPRIAITLDLEMSAEYPVAGMTEWNFQKGNLDQATKDYAVEAGQIVRERGAVLHYFCVARVLEQPDVTWLQGLAEAGHPIGNHTYDHVYVLAQTPEEVQFRFRRSPWLTAGIRVGP